MSGMTDRGTAGSPLRFAAPWSVQLKLLCALFLAALLLVAAVAGWPGLILALVLLAASAGTAVLGYSLEPGILWVHFAWGRHRIDLAGLEGAEQRAEGLPGAWRLFGFGGPFAFLGLFQSRGLGRFTVFATDLSRPVLLRFATRRVVVSPEPADTFLAALAAPRP